MRNLNCFLVNYQDNEFKKVPPEDIDRLVTIIEKIFIFSLIWSVGCTITHPGRILFDTFLRNQMVSASATFKVTIRYQTNKKTK